ncbi:MAG: serine/threonine protein kinase [Deltaproteobacteria bacterium]|nr:serine/threonine protein kinase [Deltaproteobacteria bacterium]
MKAPLEWTNLGPYRLLRRIGSGGMAEVYLACVHGASGFAKEVAIKVLRPELREDSQLTRSLIAEARLGARLNHRNLVQVHDLGVSDGVYYACLDYLDGGDLDARLSRGRLPLRLALLIGEEVASALAYLHQVRGEQGKPLGLVHRDVSPSNVLLSHCGDVKLTDYGVVKATSMADVTQANIRKGKYAYMSPEQVDGQALSAASDQFSLGVLLSQLCLGKRPFDGPGPIETTDRIREAKPPALLGLEPALVDVIHRCLAHDPSHRFVSAIELRDALRTVRGDRGSLEELGGWVAINRGRS